MTTTQRKKSRRQRGTGTVGWGRSHRGGGSRAGRGNAGSGKKADQCRRSYPKDYFGKHGFVSHQATVDTILNCRDLDTYVEKWVVTKKATKDGDVYVVDLKTLGYDKLVGGGKLTHKIKVSVSKASKSVAEKLKASGGELVAN